MRRKINCLVIAVACLFVIGVASGTASARGGLESSNPKDGSTAKTSLKNVSLSFAEPLRGGTIMVMSPSGASVTVGKAKIDSKNVKGLVVALKKGLKPGAYMIHATSVSAHGHSQDWTLSFTLKK